VDQEALRRHLLDPPEGSAAARARDYGIDLTLVLENLLLTPGERLDRAEAGSRGLAWLKTMRERNRRT
jgi:hypothetical protein